MLQYFGWALGGWGELFVGEGWWVWYRQTKSPCVFVIAKCHLVGQLAFEHEDREFEKDAILCIPSTLLSLSIYIFTLIIIII